MYISAYDYPTLLRVIREMAIDITLADPERGVPVAPEAVDLGVVDSVDPDGTVEIGEFLAGVTNDTVAEIFASVDADTRRLWLSDVPKRDAARQHCLAGCL